MANELNIVLTTGRTITARLILDGAYVGTSITCTEAPASSGHYSGNVPGATGAGHYSVVFLEGSTIVGTGSLLWDGTAERTALNLPTVAQVEARTLASSDYFNPATDTVATVTSLTNAVVLPSIPTNWITAAGLAADAVAEIQSGLATQATASAILEDTGATLPGLIGNVPTVAEFEARSLPSADYFVVSDYTAPPDISALLTTAAYTASLPANFEDLSITATTGLVATSDSGGGGGGLAQETLDAIAAILGHTSYIANAVEAGDIETDTSGLLTSAAYTASLPSNFGALGINASGHLSRVTLVDTTTTNTDMRGTDGAVTSIGNVTVGGYATGQSPADLVTGFATPANIAAAQSAILTQGNSAWTTADVSALLTTATYTASLPTNFANLSITATTGLVTTTNPGGGATAAQVWSYSGRSLDGTQASALIDILEDTSTTIPGLIGALPTLAQVQAAGFTTTRHNALIDMVAYTRPMAKQLGLVSGISATHSPTAIVVSDGDGSTTITDNGGGSYTVALT